MLRLNHTGYKTTLLKELTHYKIVIAVITKGCLPQSDQVIVEEATFYHSSGPHKTADVAFLLRQPLAWTLIAQSLFYAWLQHSRERLPIVWPMCQSMEDASPVEKDGFYHS